ncbi:hypothetical protein BKA57DRAFT_85542 [Linnemannia elongata]|nr:hypothetical protein BKA57DRAFT_85542 [Linnemannia elongata]
MPLTGRQLDQVPRGHCSTQQPTNVLLSLILILINIIATLLSLSILPLALPRSRQSPLDSTSTPAPLTYYLYALTLLYY